MKLELDVTTFGPDEHGIITYHFSHEKLRGNLELKVPEAMEKECLEALRPKSSTRAEDIEDIISLASRFKGVK